MVQTTSNYQWSSARAHLKGEDDVLVKEGPLLSLVKDWPFFIAESESECDMDILRKHGLTGRPLGSLAFFDRLQILLEKDVRPQKTSRKKKE